MSVSNERMERMNARPPSRSGSRRIHDDDVGLMGADERDGVGGPSRLGDHVDAVAHPEQADELARATVGIDDQHGAASPGSQPGPAGTPGERRVGRCDVGHPGSSLGGDGRARRRLHADG